VINFAEMWSGAVEHTDYLRLIVAVKLNNGFYAMPKMKNIQQNKELGCLEVVNAT
jgi:hypothetical protein